VALLNPADPSQPVHGAFTALAWVWGVHHNVPRNIWNEFRAEVGGENSDFAPRLQTRKRGHSGRKGYDTEEVAAKIRAMPVEKRMRLRSLALTLNMTHSTLWCHMRKLGVKAALARKHPLLQETHKLRRLLFALGHLLKNGQRWSYMDAIDENSPLLLATAAAPECDADAEVTLEPLTNEAVAEAFQGMQLEGVDDMNEMVLDLESDMNSLERFVSRNDSILGRFGADENAGDEVAEQDAQDQDAHGASDETLGLHVLAEAARALETRAGPSSTPPSRVSLYYFVDFMDVVHVDEKWFYITFEGERFYIFSDEQVPYRAVQHKSHIIKVRVDNVRDCAHNSSHCSNRLCSCALWRDHASTQTPPMAILMAR
jgi:hypothetical protein